jgi:hypothetical protein
MSYPDVHVHNSTNYSVTGTVHYAACSSDDFNLGPGTDFYHSRGACLITEITANVFLPNGSITATPYESSGTSYSQYAVIENLPGKYTVTRVVNLIGNKDEIKNTGLKHSSEFFGITPNENIEITALLIKQKQEQEIVTNWQNTKTKDFITNTGTLLCSLRSSNTENKIGVSCVEGSLQEISKKNGIQLSSEDINSLSNAFIKSLVSNRFKIKYDGNTYKTSNSQLLHWGLSAIAEPLDNGKDAVIYTIAIAVEK